MDFLGQFEQWADELQALDGDLRRAGALRDALELQEQIQCYRGILTTARENPAVQSTASVRTVLPSRRCIDLLPYPCLETDDHGMIRRANQAASMLFHLPLPLMSGQPLLVFVAKEDRRPLLTELLRLRHSKGLHTGAWLIKSKPLFDPPILTFLTAERVEDPENNFLAIVWRFSKEAD
jgi:hypothetical protein